MVAFVLILRVALQRVVPCPFHESANGDVRFIDFNFLLSIFLYRMSSSEKRIAKEVQESVDLMHR